MLIKRKGIEDLLAAFEKIKDDIPKNIHLRLYGDNKEFDVLKKLKEYHLEERASYEGWMTSEKRQTVFSNTLINVLPSYNEGLPIGDLKNDMEPFTNRDVYIYLIKKYKLFLNKYIKAIKVLKYCDDIICRPLVISYIDLLIDSDNSYKSLTDVYYKIIDNWIKREAYYIAKQDKKHTQEEIETKLFSFISEVAIFMYENYPEKLEYSIKITELKKIKNADFLEKIEGKRNRSLFNRVNEQLIFTHKSILEYVLAENFDKIKFRFEKNLNSLYKFLKDIIGENYNAKYAPLFYLNFGDTSLKIMDDNKKINELTCYIIYYSQDREFVEAMVWWYKKAIELPVLIKDKLYIRTSIAFKVQDRYIAQISPQNDLWEIIEKIMKNIKMGVANRTLVEIKVITILYECPEGLFESYYYLQNIVKNKRKVKSPSYAGANRVVENGKDS